MPDNATRVLLVEDNAGFARLIREHLREVTGRRMSVVEASSLADAVERLGADDFDAILLDLSLPDSTGGETVERVAAAAGRAPIIILTSLDDERHATEMLRLGAQDYLVKGQADGLAIVRAIRYAESRKRTQEALRRREEEFRALSENSPDCIARLDRDLRFLYVNPACARHWGSEAATLAGRRAAEAGLSGSAASALESAAKAAFAEGSEQEAEFEEADGEGVRHFHLRVVPEGPAGAPPDTVLSIARDVTRLKDAEKALRERDARLRRLEESGVFGVIYSDADGSVSDANDAFLRMVGYGREDLEAGRIDWREITPGEFLAADEHALAEARTMGSCTPYEKEYIRRNGTRVPVLIGFTALGEGRGYVCFVLDLWDLKRAEGERNRVLAENARQRDFLSKLVAYAPVGVAVVEGPRFRYTFANESFRRIPVSDTAMLGRTVAEVFPGLAEQGGIRLLEEACESGETVRVREYMAPVRAGRRETWWDADLVPLRDENDEFSSVLIIVSDVTENVLARRRLEEMAAEAEVNLAQLEAVVNHMTEGLVIAGPDGHVLSMNPAALRMHGYETLAEAREAMGVFAGPWEVSSLDGRPLEPGERPMARVLAGETFARMEVRLRNTRSGRVWYASFGGTLVRDRDGQITLAILTMRDVTESRQFEQALQSLNEALEARVRERTMVAESRAAQLRVMAIELTQAEQRERRRIAVLLHDNLQQLLAASKMWLAMALAQAGEDEADAIREAEGLLTEAIAASRSLSIELSPPILYDTGLAPALDWLARWMLEKHGLDVAVDAQAGADLAEPVKILLFQATRELLFNVVKHAGVRQAAVSMRVGDDGIARVEVSDRGVGFDPATVEPGDEPLTGFGLFSIAERIGLMGGDIEIDSRPGEGTTVALTCPSGKAVRRPDGEAPAPASRKPARARRRKGRPIRMLLVDDHEILRKGLVSLLSSARDIEVIAEAGDGIEAVEMVCELRPDVVIMDISLPGISGIEATRRIVRECPGTRVVGLSLHEEGDMAQAMREAGASAYLTKGGPADALIAAVRSAARDGGSSRKGSEEGAGK